MYPGNTPTKEHAQPYCILRQHISSNRVCDRPASTLSTQLTLGPLAEHSEVPRQYSIPKPVPRIIIPTSSCLSLLAAGTTLSAGTNNHHCKEFDPASRAPDVWMHPH